MVAHVRRIEPDAQQNRKVVDGRSQVFEPAQRGTVGPVRIVDYNKEPLGQRQVRERPVQAVKRGAQSVSVRGDLRGGPAEAQRDVRQRGRVVEHVGALGFRDGKGRREEAAYDPPRVHSPELAATSAEDA